nr:hypothetical protein [Tanacetum cinerariifolium]
MKGYVEQLECLGYVLPQDLIVGLILNGLTSDFVEFKLLKAKGKGKVNGKGKDKLVYIPKPKNPKPSTKEHTTKDDACHQCKEVGHWKRNCPVYLAGLMKKKKQVVSASSLDKKTRKPFRIVLERVNDLLGIIYTDVCGPLRHVSRQGASYFITFTDDYSHYGYVCLLKHKHEVFETFKVFKNGVDNQLGKTIKALQSDRGGEYISQEFKDYLKAYGMNLTTLPLSFWEYAIESVTRILNMVPTKVDKTLHELLYGKVLNLSYLKVWSCEALVKRDTLDKWYTEFFEKSLISQEISGRAVDLKEIQDEDTSPSKITSKITMEVKGFEPPYEDVIMIRRAIRILIAIAAFYDYEIWQMDVKTAFLNGYLDEDIYMVQPEVDWKSSKQSTTSMLAIEAEYIVALEATMEAVWIRKFISGLVPHSLQHHPVTINTIAIALPTITTTAATTTTSTPPHHHHYNHHNSPHLSLTITSSLSISEPPHHYPTIASPPPPLLRQPPPPTTTTISPLMFFLWMVTFIFIVFA